MTSTYDITAFTAADTTFMHLKSPIDEEPIFIKNGDEKTPVGITFHSPGSEAHEAASAKRTNRALHRNKRKIDLTADLLRSDTVSFLTDVTISFNGLAYPPAGPASGEDLFRALYSDRKFGWVVDQANAHLADWASFTTGSATS
jgi:hypothetical protein